VIFHSYVTLPEGINNIKVGVLGDWPPGQGGWRDFPCAITSRTTI
jgi:hypothetical protein